MKLKAQKNKKIKGWFLGGKSFLLIFLPKERALPSMWHEPEGKQ